MSENDREKPELPAAAKRALAEAEQRRAALIAAEKERPVEKNGRGGLDPVRQRHRQRLLAKTFHHMNVSGRRVEGGWSVPILIEITG